MEKKYITVGLRRDTADKAHKVAASVFNKPGISRNGAVNLLLEWSLTELAKSGKTDLTMPKGARIVVGE